MPPEALDSRVETNDLSALEIASHIVLGSEDTGDRPRPAPDASPIAVLERSLLQALLRPPCIVAFSGGRDSSALLSVAARVARREGLADPIPATLLFPAARLSDEADWQAQVIDHLGLTSWVRQTFTDELDLVGPVAQASMRRDGLPYPYNLHLLATLIAQARGGSFVTGLGGDQYLNPAGPSLDILARRRRPSGRDILHLGLDVSPRPVRRFVLRNRVGLEFPWLRPEANAQLSSAWREAFLREPLRCDRRLWSLWRSRLMRHTIRRIAASGEQADVAVHQPFAEVGFVAALARHAGATGFASRTSAMHALFGDVLPAELVGRATKASFNEVLWNRHTRAFIEDIDEAELKRALVALELDALVDSSALAAHWAAPDPLANSFLLLQACWLALHPGESA